MVVIERLTAAQIQLRSPPSIAGVAAWNQFPKTDLSARSALARLAPEKNSFPWPRICSNRHHLLLPSPSASHTPVHPPSTPVDRLPNATQRRHRKPI